MAHIKILYLCPVCNNKYENMGNAIKCRDQHVIKSEKWAFGKGGKAVRFSDNCAPDSLGGVNWALREADLSDNIEERRKQLEQGS